MLIICFDVVDGDCDVYEMMIVLLCLCNVFLSSIVRVTSGIVSTLQQKTTTGFAPNDRGVASDDLVVDNPMSGRADCTNVGISGHCGLLQPSPRCLW